MNLPSKGTIYPDQDVVSCMACGLMMHTDCVKEFGTTILGKHVMFTDETMRNYVVNHGLLGYRVAFCAKCYGKWKERIVRNYRDSGREAEAALFLEEIGRFREAGEARR